MPILDGAPQVVRDRPARYGVPWQAGQADQRY